MLDWSTVKEVADFVAKLAVPLLGYGAYILRDIREEIRKLRESLLVLETQREAHQRLFSGEYLRQQRQRADERREHENQRKDVSRARRAPPDERQQKCADERREYADK